MPLQKHLNAGKILSGLLMGGGGGGHQKDSEVVCGMEIKAPSAFV